MRTALPFLLLLAAASAADPEDADVLAARLGDDDPAVRQKAEHELLRLGSAAQAALINASRSADPEVAQRAKDILANLVWAEPGKESGGLRFVVRAEESYAADGPVAIRARLINTTDKDITVAGAHMAEPDESDIWGLELDGGEELHMCFGARVPLPDVPETLVVPANDWVAFAVHPEAWCAFVAHSKCHPVSLPPGRHSLRFSLNLPNAADRGWSGRVQSNAVTFEVGK